jgi:hypothetical protein
MFAPALIVRIEAHICIAFALETFSSFFGSGEAEVAQMKDSLAFFDHKNTTIIHSLQIKLCIFNFFSTLSNPL